MKYPNLFKAFNRHIDLPIDVYLDLEGRLVHKKIGKKEFLFREGEVVKYLPFINDGLMINYIVDRGWRRTCNPNSGDWIMAW